MAPLLKDASLSPKIVNVLNLLQQIEDFEAKMELLMSVPVPDVDRELLKAFEDANPDPNPNRKLPVHEDYDPVAQVANKDLSQLSFIFETGAIRNLKEAKEQLMCDYRLLLKVLLVSGGVESIAPKYPLSHLDEKALRMLGSSLIEDSDKSVKKDSDKSVKKAEPVSIDGDRAVVAEWLRARGSVISKRFTECLDRTLGVGTELLLSKGLNKVTGGTIASLLEENKALQDALKGLGLEDGKDNGEAETEK